MSKPDPAYHILVSWRIVRMFERYVQTVNPDEKRFQAFISKYITGKGVKELESFPYSELYKVIKEGIREYLRQEELGSRSKK